MKKHHLTQSKIDKLSHRKKVFSIRDNQQNGLIVRVYPTGKKVYCLQATIDKKRIWQKLGDAYEISLDDARIKAQKTLSDKQAERLGVIKPICFEEAVDVFLMRYKSRIKPSTFVSYAYNIQRYILPYFKGWMITDITREDVVRWFAGLADKPGVANYSKSIFAVMMQQAEYYGFRPLNSNPCRNIPRYKQKQQERFLSDNEWQRLGAALSGFSATYPMHTDLILLLAYTGCRKHEIIHAKWSYYQEGHLHLPDSKTGAKTVFLSRQARLIIERQARMSAFIFAREAGKPITAPQLTKVWNEIRQAAQLHNVRLHDLRHSYASLALRHNETIPMVGRLLGHKDPETTLKYAHVAGEQIINAAHEMAQKLARGI